MGFFVKGCKHIMTEKKYVFISSTEYLNHTYFFLLKVTPL